MVQKRKTSMLKSVDNHIRTNVSCCIHVIMRGGVNLSANNVIKHIELQLISIFSA